MTKFYCPGCGKHFSLCANEGVTRDFERWWEAEHAECQALRQAQDAAAYHAALALVERIDSPLKHNWDVWVCGQQCSTLDEAVGVLVGALGEQNEIRG